MARMNQVYQSISQPSMNLSSNMTIEQIENMRKETEQRVKVEISNRDTRRSEASHQDARRSEPRQQDARRNEPRQQDARRSEAMRKKWLNTYIVKNILNLSRKNKL